MDPFGLVRTMLGDCRCPVTVGDAHHLPILILYVARVRTYNGLIVADQVTDANVSTACSSLS